MSDWRTARAPYATRSRLPEDDLPEIDWGAASFAPGGGDEPEPEPMPDPGEEERAMARLRARIAERDAAEGLMDPWAQEQAAPMGPQSPPLPGSPAPLRVPRDGRTMAGAGLSMGMPEMLPPAAPAAPPMTPQQMAQAAFRQPALDAVRAGVGAVTPPVDPMAPPPTPTAPDAVPQATTNPDAPTVTAGSQAAGLAQRPAAPQSPTTDPTGAPQFAMGATGLGGPQAGMSERVQAGVGGGVFDRQVGAARGEDARRDRLRRILTGIGAMLALRSGNAGFMVPAAIAGGLVRRPDEEATLRANDERAQAVGGAQAEQRALLEQLAMRREAQQAQERQGQQTLALRAAELQGTQADRATRTGLAVAEEGRAADDRDPDSARSGRVRSQFRQWLRTAPAEIVRNVDQGSLDGMAAEELILLQEELSSNYNSNLHGGGRGVSGGAGAGAAAGLRAGQRQGLEEVPEAYVNMIRSRIGADQDANATAQVLWQRESPEEQASYLRGTQADRWRTRRLAGYEQEDGGLDVSEATIQATQEDIEQLARLQGMEERAMAAAEQTSGGALAANVVGVSLQDQVTEYNVIRNDLIGILNRIQSGSSLDASERVNWEQMIPGLSDPRALLSGDPQRALRIAFRSARQQLDDRIRVRGFRATTPGGTGPTTTADAPPAPEREHTITIRFTRNGETRSRTVPISEADRWRAQAVAGGWTVVQ